MSTRAASDVFARRIVGWRVSASLRSALALDALEHAINYQTVYGPLICRSDRGVRYRAICHSERIEEAYAERSVGSRVDWYDCELAESIISQFKAEPI